MKKSIKRRVFVPKLCVSRLSRMLRYNGKATLVCMLILLLPGCCYGACDVSVGNKPMLMTSMTGRITSPSFSRGMYTDNQDCVWSIHLNPGSKIELTFDSFDLPPPNGKTCEDYIKVVVGQGINGPLSDELVLLNETCDSMNSPLRLVSSGEKLTIKFHSDESGAKRGFSAVYRGLCQSDVIHSSVLATPHYPGPPPDGVTCTWFVGSPGAATRIKIRRNSLEQSLPICGTSPFKVISDESSTSGDELCSSATIWSFLGNVTLVYDPKASNITVAWPGQVEINIIHQNNVSKCVRLCGQSKTCQKNVARIWFNDSCLCPTVWQGWSCDNVTDSVQSTASSDATLYCAKETDNFIGSGITWRATAAGSVDLQLCPSDVLGDAKRYCISEPESVRGGLWTRPDLSQCENTEIYNIVRDLELMYADPISINYVKLFKIAQRLANATSRVLELTPEWHPLFPGDILSAVHALVEMTTCVDQIDLFSTEEAGTLIQHYMFSIDNIVEQKAVDIVQNARADLVEAMASKIAEFTQRLVLNVLGKCPGLSVSDTTPQDADYRSLFGINLRNMDIQIIQMVPNSSFAYEAETSSLYLPDSAFGQNENASSDDVVTVYLARFKTLSQFLSMTETRFHKDPPLSNFISSDIISAEVIGQNIQYLKDPVNLTFQIRPPSNHTSQTAHCVFMNMTARSFEDRWSKTGCKSMFRNETHVVCHCYHLTNFALLMDIYNSQDSIKGVHSQLLSYISYIGSCLSIVSCLAIIALVRYFRLSSERVRIHQHLGATIILVQGLFLLIGQPFVAQGTPWWACLILAAMMHYAITALFCWMLVEGIHLYEILVQVFKTGSNLKKYTILGWGFPLIVVGISMAGYRDTYGQASLCWLRREVLLTCLVPTVALVIMVNTVLLAMVIRVMVKSNSCTIKSSAQDRSSLKMSIKASVVLLPLLGLTWVFAFLTFSAHDNGPVFYIFTYLFTILNSCQGLLFFVFHGLLNAEIKVAFERRYRRRNKSWSESYVSRNRKASDLWACVDDVDQNTLSPTVNTISLQASIRDMSSIKPRYLQSTGTDTTRA